MNICGTAEWDKSGRDWDRKKYFFMGLGHKFKNWDGMGPVPSGLHPCPEPHNLTEV